jgi:hypothetical protein
MANESSDKNSLAPARPIELVVYPERLARYVLIFCISAEITFLLLDYYLGYGRTIKTGALRRLFSITREDGLASWFGTTQTFLAGLTLWVIYLFSKRTPAPRWKTISWFVLVIFFVYLAIDDGAQIHERVGTAVKRMAGSSLDFFPSYTWHLVFLPIFAAFGVFGFVFLWIELRATYARTLLIVAFSCLALAVLLDFVEGLDRYHRWNVYGWLAEDRDLHAWALQRFGRSAYDTFRHFGKAIEEFLEMLAITLLWFLFIRQVAVVADNSIVRFVSNAKTN